MTRALALSCLLGAYLFVILPFTEYMRTKPFAEKLGYVPRPEILRMVSADQKQLLGSSLVMKVLFYYGTLVEKTDAKLDIPPDYFSIYKALETATKLDPYNMDAYYFAQAVLVWDVKRVKEVNELLEYGMKYRNWDFYLPFFAGFNYAYFLKDNANAAKHYQRAGELTGEELHVNLAGRYLYESGQTDLAIAYLKAMVKRARNSAVRKSFEMRLAALEEVKRIESAVFRFRSKYGESAVNIADLLRLGFLRSVPVDPYGGSFYIDKSGKVMSTSRFSPRIKAIN